VLLRVAHEIVAASGLADAVAALRAPAAGSSVDSLFHDEEIDGPLPDRLRVLALALADERTVVAARVAGLDDVDLLAAQDVPDVPGEPSRPAGAGATEQQLAILAVRLEMAAVYLRLVRG